MTFDFQELLPIKISKDHLVRRINLPTKEKVKKNQAADLAVRKYVEVMNMSPTKITKPSDKSDQRYFGTIVSSNKQYNYYGL